MWFVREHNVLGVISFASSCSDARHLASLGLSFLIYTMGLIMHLIPASGDCFQDQKRQGR